MTFKYEDYVKLKDFHGDDEINTFKIYAVSTIGTSTDKVYQLEHSYVSQLLLIKFIDDIIKIDEDEFETKNNKFKEKENTYYSKYYADVESFEHERKQLRQIYDEFINKRNKITNESIEEKRQKIKELQLVEEKGNGKTKLNAFDEIRKLEKQILKEQDNHFDQIEHKKYEDIQNNIQKLSDKITILQKEQSTSIKSMMNEIKKVYIYQTFTKQNDNYQAFIDTAKIDMDTQLFFSIYYTTSGYFNILIYYNNYKYHNNGGEFSFKVNDKNDDTTNHIIFEPCGSKKNIMLKANTSTRYISFDDKLHIFRASFRELIIEKTIL